MAIAISISLSFQRLSKLNQYVCDLIHNTDLNDGLKDKKNCKLISSLIYLFLDHQAKKVVLIWSTLDKNLVIVFSTC